MKRHAWKSGLRALRMTRERKRFRRGTILDHGFCRRWEFLANFGGSIGWAEVIGWALGNDDWETRPQRRRRIADANRAERLAPSARTIAEMTARHHYFAGFDKAPVRHGRVPVWVERWEPMP